MDHLLRAAQDHHRRRKGLPFAIAARSHPTPRPLSGREHRLGEYPRKDRTRQDTAGAGGDGKNIFKPGDRFPLSLLLLPQAISPVTLPSPKPLPPNPSFLPTPPLLHHSPIYN